MIRQFDSIAALRAEALRLNLNHYLSGDNWIGGETTSEILRKSLVGDTTLVPKAEKLIDQLSTQIETPHRVWERSPIGAFCVVPDVLAGLPTPMRRQLETGSEHSPISIFADVGSSASLPAALLAQRGTVILALTLALCRIRPVSLHIIDCSDGNRDGSGETVIIARVETAPLDLASACYALTSIGLVRWMIYEVEKKLNDFRGSWPRGFSLANPQPYYDKLLPRIAESGGQALIIPAARANDPIIAQPITWLNAQIARFTHQEENAT